MIIIRKYSTQDKPSIINLLRLNTPHYFSLTEEQDLEYYLDYKIDSYFVIEIDHKIVGCGGFNLAENASIGKLSWDILHPEFQNKGLGTKLVEYRIQLLKNLPSIKTISVRTSQLTYKFYEKSGFKLIEIKENYWAEGFHLYTMILE